MCTIHSIDGSSQRRAARAQPRWRARAGAALLGLVIVAASLPADARNRLGAVGNIALRNPSTPDPQSDAFGVANASGDFDGDGIDDLAVADREHPDTVRIYRGVGWTINPEPFIPFFPEVADLPTVAGSSLGPNVVLAVGNFDLDPDDAELAVGIPGDSQANEGAGAVFILNRTNSGWHVTHTIRQGAAGYPGSADAEDHLGAALAVGRFDDDATDDLAIGVPGETLTTTIEAGVVMIAYGSIAGLSSAGSEVFFRGANGLTGEPQDNEQFGFALAAADFDGDAVDDLAIGIPGATCAGHPAAGSVLVLRGTDNSGGLSAAGAAYWNQATLGIAGACENGDRFGWSLAAAPFSGALAFATADLAIGVPFENVDGVAGAGAVAIIYSDGDGLTAAGNQLLHEDLFPGGTLRPALFGSTLAAAHFGDVPSGPRDLLIGVPAAPLGELTIAGALWIVPYSSGHLNTAAAQSIVLTAALRAGPARQGDAFGARVSAGDFNGDGFADLAISVPGHADDGAEDAGAVQVIYQSDYLFVDGFD